MRTSVRSAVRGLLPGRLVGRVGVLLVLLVALGASGAGTAAAAPSEPILFLGIARGPGVDKLATQVVTDHLTDRQENLVGAAAIAESDRRCRRAQCLGTLATGRKAELVLSGDVSEITGAKNTLRVQMHLFDARRRELLDQESLCADCDDTKLGILLTSTTSELLLRYRKAASASAQVNSLLDALEKEKQAAPGAGAAPLGSAGAANGGASATPPGVLPMAPPGVLPLPSQTTAPLPGQVTLPPLPTAPPLPAAQAAQTVQAAQNAQNAQAAVPSAERPVAYPTPLPPPPVFPAAQPVPDERPAQAPRRGLSPKRKAIAGVFGALGAGTLVASIVLTALDQRLDPKLSYNPSGSACNDPMFAGRNCVLSMVRLWGPGYGLSALLLGGMVLTLALPESSK